MDFGGSILRMVTSAIGPLVATALWHGWRRRQRRIDLTGEPGDDGLDDSDMVVCQHLASQASPTAGEPLVRQLAPGPASYDGVS